MENRLIPLYRPFLDRLIVHWREQAWNNFQKLQTHSTTNETIEKRAQRIALRLTHFKKASHLLRQ